MATPTQTLPLHPAPSSVRVEPGSVNLPVADLSKIKTDDDLPQDVETATAEWVNAFNKAIQSPELSGLSDLFLPDSFWRDHLCLAWSCNTLQGPEQMKKFLDAGCKLKSVAIDKSSDFRKPTATTMAFGGRGKLKVVQTFLTTESDVGRGLGVARLVFQEGKPKAFTLFTSMREIKGYEEAARPEGVILKACKERENWQELRNKDQDFTDDNPTVLIIGAGQAGLATAARLKMLGVNALIIDKNKRVGDSWRNRYHQLALHDPVWWPVYTPKDKLAGFLEAYAQLLELNIWMETTVRDSEWDDLSKKWTVVVKRQLEQGVEERILTPKHVIQATGLYGEKKFPFNIRGRSQFRGSRLCHSSEFSGARAGGKGKKALVVGSGESAHDIAQDFYEKDYKVTMIQRSSTCVISAKALLEKGLAGLYDEQSPPVEDADVALWSIPSSVLKSLQQDVTTDQNKHDKNMLSGLEKAGFKLDKGPDNAGLFMQYYQGSGRFYIDFGASQLIIDGKIKVKQLQSQDLAHILPKGIEFSDGLVLPADEIVFATGYKNLRTTARKIFGDALADRVKDVWGFNEAGELRTIWQKSDHPGFLFVGGHLAMCRYWSRIIALQIKGLEEGIWKYDDR